MITGSAMIAGLGPVMIVALASHLAVPPCTKRHNPSGLQFENLLSELFFHQCLDSQNMLKGNNTK